MKICSFDEIETIMVEKLYESFKKREEFNKMNFENFRVYNDIHVLKFYKIGFYCFLKLDGELIASAYDVDVSKKMLDGYNTETLIEKLDKSASRIETTIKYKWSCS